MAAAAPSPLAGRVEKNRNEEVPQPRLLLSVEERHEKHRILLRDTFALAALAALVLVFSFVTYLLFHSFATHRLMLERRWRARGDASLAAGNPVAALASLHSALAYAPDDRGLQIELATALAAAGHTQEAQTYFNTLLESEPGSGMINLQLGRLATHQNNAQSAVDHYQAAIDGTWNGDAYTRRREIRLELSKYLIGQDRLPEARNQLLIAAGNAPQDAGLQLQVGKLLVDAGDPSDGMDVFHRAAQDKGARLAGLLAEGQTSMAMGRFQAAHTFLGRAVDEPKFNKQSDAEKKSIRDALQMTTTVLALYPADTLSPQERARRIETDGQLAEARLLSCPAAPPATVISSPGTAPAANSLEAGRPQLLSGLASHLRSLNPLAKKTPPATPASASGLSPDAAPGTTPGGGLPPAPNPANDPLSVLAARWTAMPTGAALQQQLVTNADFANSTVQLIYSTARATSALCGPLTGQDAALARIAADPVQVEAQQ